MSDFLSKHDTALEADARYSVGEGGNGIGDGNAGDCTGDQTVAFYGVARILAQHQDTYVPEEALAQGFGVSTRTIRRWVKDGTLPPQTPGLRMWRIGNINSWFNERTEIEERSVRKRLEEEREFMEE